MSVIPTGLQFGSGPGKSVYIGPAALYQPVDLHAGVADIKPGMPLGYKASGYTNECDRIDSAALALLAFAVADAPTRGEAQGTIIDPMTDYVYSDNETVKAFFLLPGVMFWGRCADNTTTISIGTECEAIGSGLITGSIDALTVATSSTGNTHFDPSPTGENIKLTPKFMSLKARATSATESWLPVLYIGR